MRILILILATLFVAPAVAVSDDAGPAFAARGPDGKALVVPAEQRSKGTVYYALTGRDRQVYIESNAPLENIKGQSNDVIGYAVAPESSRGSLAAGEWQLPVTSIQTGIDLRDEHLAGKDWLDAKSHPYVVFQLEEIEDLSEVKRTDAFASYVGTLVGQLTLHGVTRSIRIPGTTLTFLKESDSTREVAKGDLLSIRSRFTVTLKDYDVSHPVIGDKVANEVEIDVALYLSTNPPNES